MRLLLTVAVAALLVACGAEGEAEALRTLAPSEPPSSSMPVEDEPQPVIPGLDGQALIDALIAEGLVCEGPKEFTTALSQWDCAAEETDVPGVRYDVVILGRSLDEVHSVDAGVDQSAAGAVDPALAAGFLGFVAMNASFEGADPESAVRWVSENRSTEQAEMTAGDVLYFLRGPDFLRGLQIVAPE